MLIDPVADCNLSTYYDLALASTDKLSLLRGFFGCLAAALNYLHEKRITHQDIKPQNILVKADRVLLTDFGFSRDWENLSKSTTVSDTGKTWQYAAPEIARYEPRNTATDIWSLGCVFLEMATVLQGKPIREMQLFFESRSWGTRRFFNNITNFGPWMDKLRGEDRDSGQFCSTTPAGSNMSNVDAALEWVSWMLRDEKKERITAAELYGRIEKAPPVGGISYCRPCCREDEDDSSFADEDDGDVWCEA